MPQPTLPSESVYCLTACCQSVIRAIKCFILFTFEGTLENSAEINKAQ